MNEFICLATIKTNYRDDRCYRRVERKYHTVSAIGETELYEYLAHFRIANELLPTDDSGDDAVEVSFDRIIEIKRSFPADLTRLESSVVWTAHISALRETERLEAEKEAQHALVREARDRVLETQREVDDRALWLILQARFGNTQGRS